MTILRLGPSRVRSALPGVAAVWLFGQIGCSGETPATGNADGGSGGAAGASDASPSGATVVSLGDKTSLGWTIAIPPQEVARRLSQFLLQQPPSAALTAAIVAAAPATNQDVGELTEGLLLDEGSLAGRRAFYSWWLELDFFAPFFPDSEPPRDPVLFPLFTPDVREALVDQTLAFIEDITWRADGDLSTLLTEPAAFVTTATAPWFPGVEVPAGNAATRVALDPGRYAGIVTQPPVVAAGDFAARTSPIYRGGHVLAHYLCQSVPPPPVGEPHLVPDPAHGITIRQSVEAYGSSPGCALCHQFLDPPGFAFGHFDAVGAYHDTEGGLPVDTTGVLTSVVGTTGFSFDQATSIWSATPPAPPSGGATGAITFSFDGPASLASHLATLPDVRTCFAAQWLTFATGMSSSPDSSPFLYDFLDAANGGRSLAADADYVVKRATIGGRLNLRGTIRAVTETHAFLDP